MPANVKLRIVHIMRAPMGGVYRHVRDLALQHTQAGHEVGVICDMPGTPGYQEAGLQQLDIHLALGIHRVPMGRSVGVSDVASGRRILAMLKTLRPDVVHGHGAKGGVYARALAGLSLKGRKVARIYSPHGGSLHYDPKSRSGKIYFAAERLMERQTDAIMFVARYEKETYASKIGEPSCETHVIYNGLAKSEFRRARPAPNAADFLFIGEVRDLKGYDLVINAARKLINDGFKSLRIIMVGSGPEEAKADAMIAAAGLHDVIDRRPPIPARDAFSLARCVVMPSRAEAMPYIVIEALGAGLPIIASKVGGIPEIFAGSDAAMIEPEVGEVGDAMAAFLNNPEKLAASMPSQALLKSRFSAEVMGQSVLNAYRAALSD